MTYKNLNKVKSCSIYERCSYNKRYYKLRLTGDTIDLWFLEINFKKKCESFIEKNKDLLERYKVCPKLTRSYSTFTGGKIHCLEVITIPIKVPISVYKS